MTPERFLDLILQIIRKHPRTLIQKVEKNIIEVYNDGYIWQDAYENEFWNSHTDITIAVLPKAINIVANGKDGLNDVYIVEKTPEDYKIRYGQYKRGELIHTLNFRRG